MSSLIAVPELFMNVKGLIAYTLCSFIIPVVRSPLNLGFCLDSLKCTLTASIILKPIL